MAATTNGDDRSSVFSFNIRRDVLPLASYPVEFQFIFVTTTDHTSITEPCPDIIKVFTEWIPHTAFLVVLFQVEDAELAPRDAGGALSTDHL